MSREKKREDYFPTGKQPKRPGVEEKYRNTTRFEYRNMSQPNMCQYWAAVDNHHHCIIGYPFSRRFTRSPGCLPDRVYDMVFIIRQQGPATVKSAIFGGRCRGSATYIETLLLCNQVINPCPLPQHPWSRRNRQDALEYKSFIYDFTISYMNIF